MLSLSAIVVFGAVNLVAPRPYGNTEQKTALPVDNGRITSGYGHRKDPLRKGVSFHEGVDIAAPYGSTIRPIAQESSFSSVPMKGLVIWWW
jgi:murein DD-endopeptidase MepM/ murein hydrolase activator NlpD